MCSAESSRPAGPASASERDGDGVWGRSPQGDTAEWPAHPLVAVLEGAAHGRFPPADGSVEILAPDAAGTSAVVAFTGHAYVLADVDPADVAAMGADGFGRALAPAFLSWLAREGGAIGSVDVVLVARGGGDRGVDVIGRDDLADHPRVRRATAHRRAVEVFGADAGLVVIGRGLVGRHELAVELFRPAAASAGNGRRLIRAGLAHVPQGELCWAQVAAGNAASLRAFLASGFVPVGAEVLLDPA